MMMTAMSLKLQDYEVIRWKSVETQKLHSGFRIGEYLVVCKSVTDQKRQKWAIYSKLNGKKFVNANFDTENTAIILAEFFDTSFYEYFILQTEYPDADLPSLTQYTIPDGQKVNEFARWLECNPVKLWTLEEIRGHIG